MAKPHKDPPLVGDKVRLRGRDPVGVIKAIGGPSNKWVAVKWDIEKSGPGMVHINELEKFA